MLYGPLSIVLAWDSRIPIVKPKTEEFGDGLSSGIGAKLFHGASGVGLHGVGGQSHLLGHLRYQAAGRAGTLTDYTLSTCQQAP